MGSVAPGAGRESPAWCGFGEMPTPDCVRNELNKVLDSATFRNSPALRRFLRYTVEHSIQGEGERLKEYRLGVEVFGRSSSYEPQQDPIVRLEARRLRAKLREYYEEEGSHDPVRITIPKGGYAAAFSGNGHPELLTALPAAEIAPPAQENRFPSRATKIWVAGIICILGVLLIGWSATSRHGSQRNDTIQTTSIAVLPFQNLSEDTAQDYLADGITETLIDSLSRLPMLRVLARSTVFHYKGENSDPQKIGNQLHVNAVLTGRLMERNHILIAQAELTDVATGALLWDTQYNRKLNEIHTLQEDISRDVSRHLRLHLTGEQVTRLGKPPTDSSEAFQLYLRGRYEWNKRTEDGFTKAIEYFDKAIDKDPHYALAYAGQADSYVLLAEYTVIASKDALPKAQQAAEKALELDETVAEGHTSLGAVRADYDWDWQGAEREFRRAIELNPNYPTAHQWYAELLSQQGRHDEAIAEVKRALELDPLSLVINTIGGRVFRFAGKVDQAIEQLNKTLELDPNFSLANYDLGKAYLQKGMTSEAIAELQKSVNLFRVSESDAALAYAYARFGKRNEARSVLESYLRQSQSAYVSWYGMAFIYAGLDDKDNAFSSLAKAYEQHDVRLRDLKIEPMFESLRLDPRFVRLVRQVGLP